MFNAHVCMHTAKDTSGSMLDHVDDNAVVPDTSGEGDSHELASQSGSFKPLAYMLLKLF